MSTVLITGAGAWFGKAAALALAARGHDVIATTETAEQADALAAEHPELTTQKLDVTDPADVAGVAALDPDVLINNAGLGDLGLFERLDPTSSTSSSASTSPASPASPAASSAA